MARTQVYSWRVDPEQLEALKAAARARGESVATILHAATQEWLAREGVGGEEEAARQARLHAAAAPFVGAVDGQDPDRSRTVRARVRERLRRRREG